MRLALAAPLFVTTLFGAALCALATPARAAESYDNCSGTISSLPVVISTQGVWCMKGDLATALSSGIAIEVTTNNVTIDCNHFKLGGLAAGAGTATTGIRANARLNVRVRNCHVRGFYHGVVLTGGAGQVVEDSIIEASRTIGAYVAGDGSMIRGNLFADTGQAETSLVTQAVFAGGGTHVIDNTIDGVVPTGSAASAFGIYHTGTATVADNRIGGLVPGASGHATGIVATNTHSWVKDNYVDGGDIVNSSGIACADSTTTTTGNVIARTTNGVVTCYSTGNIHQP